MALNTLMRTHTCGELNPSFEKKEVQLCGWVHSTRDHGGIIFVDVRDRYGITQLVFEPSVELSIHKKAESLRREWVIQAKGVVRRRAPDMVNPRLPTGGIEVTCSDLTVLNESEQPPFLLDEWSDPTDAMRFKYRYLDLRRPEMQRYVTVRHRAAQASRAFLSAEGFLEIETPLLVRSTPEGARDFLVPSRMNPGCFYSLPQSPQLYKQILMVSGCDRYFQIARCLRDEDLRADRQPEFTQIDIEASFIDEEFIYDLAERLMQRIFRESRNLDLAVPFPRMTYEESMERYGSDKPDLRYGLTLTDVTAIVGKSDFTVFKNVVEKGGIVKCIAPKGEFSRTDLDGYIAFAQKCGAKGMAWMKVAANGLESNIVKYFSPAVQEALLKAVKPEKGATLMFIADKPKTVNDVISRLRAELARNLKLITPDDFKFCWVTDFPLFEWDEEEKKVAAAHHIFTSPKAEHMDFLEKEPLKVRARCYDLVLNGIEIASGSIRIHQSDIQKRVMAVIGMSEADAEKRFGFLLEAFRYGAPPHGGIAPGFDRLVALLCGHNDIREVIAFPKTASGTSLLDGSPTEADPKALRELKIKPQEKPGGCDA